MGRSRARATYEIDANWKLVAENFMEYYHLPWVHPGLVKVSPINAHYRWQGPGTYIGFCTSPIASNSEEGGWDGLPAIPGLERDGRGERALRRALPERRAERAAEPRLRHADAPDGRRAHDRDDVPADELRVAGHEAGEAAIDELMRFWHAVNLEDVEIVEVVQRGLANTSYTGGRMCYRFEESVHRFQNLVIDRMLGIDHIPEGDAVEQAPDVRARA